jgi:CRP/FNR family transcriptional regulator, anaerobic regulatory protein
MLARLKPRYVHYPIPDCNHCAIRDYSPCSGVPEALLNRLQRLRNKPTTLQPKTHLYRQGDVQGQFYLLYNGWVMLYKTLRTGKRHILRYALPGDFISLQSDLNSPMNHSAQSLTPSILCSFPRRSVIEIMENMPQFTTQLALLSARYYEYQTSISHRSAQESIAFLFLDFYERIKLYEQGSIENIFLPITQEDIADTLGLTPVHVNRTLRLLAKQGVLEFQHQQLKVNDLSALYELAGYEPYQNPSSLLSII